jgi:hypothetical protein
VHLLSLLGRSNLAGPDSPDGLVSNDNLAPVRDLGLERLELLGDDLDSLPGLALLQALAAAPDDANAVLGSELGLGGDIVIRLLQDGAALRVAEDSPCDAKILELGDGGLASEGTIGLVEDVLGSNLDTRLEMLASVGQVGGRGRNDDL